MKRKIFFSARVRRRMEATPLGITLSRFVEHLIERGYAKQTIHLYVQGVEHFGYWLGRKGLTVEDIDPLLIERFYSKHFPHCRCPKPATRSTHALRPGLRHFWTCLCDEGFCQFPTVERSSVDDLVEAFDQHLEEACGLAPATRFYRRRYARDFLEQLVCGGEIRLGNIQPRSLVRYIVGKAQSLKPSSVQVLSVSLRSLVRFLQFRGLIRPGLEKAILSAANWGCGSIPEILSLEEQQSLLKSFDRSNPAGRRDFAMALLQLELGLRAVEVAQLTLDDLLWRDGVVAIPQTKSRKERHLPLPRRVGTAVSNYLRNGRPPSSIREVFLRHTLPVGAPIAAQHVRGAMRRAYARADLGTNRTGTHVLRRTFASRLHQAGSTLKEIADLLGHQSIDTTTTYTRIDLCQLRAVALPWPKEK